MKYLTSLSNVGSSAMILLQESHLMYFLIRTGNSRITSLWGDAMTVVLIWQMDELDWVHKFSMKSCDQCLKEMNTLFRVRVSTSKEWIFVCRGCLEVVRPSNPHYQYGGTWKNRKSRKWRLAEPKATASRTASALVISHFVSSHRHRIDQGENIFQGHGTRP